MNKEKRIMSCGECSQQWELLQYRTKQLRSIALGKGHPSCIPSLLEEVNKHFQHWQNCKGQWHPKKHLTERKTLMAHSSKLEIENAIRELIKNTTAEKLSELQKRYGKKLLDKVFSDMLLKSAPISN